MSLCKSRKFHKSIIYFFNKIQYSKIWKIGKIWIHSREKFWFVVLSIERWKERLSRCKSPIRRIKAFTSFHILSETYLLWLNSESDVIFARVHEVLHICSLWMNIFFIDDNSGHISTISEIIFVQDSEQCSVSWVHGKSDYEQPVLIRAASLST